MSARAPFSAERRRAILDALRVQGRVGAAELADRLGVTGETVRRDLIALEREGRLVRVHGGAIPLERTDEEAAVSARVDHDAEKRRIARAALAHVPAPGTVLLDAGSTTARLAELLPAAGDLVVFTNALPIAAGLLERTELEVHLVGGRTRRATEASVGPWANRALRELNVDVVFAGTNGVAPDRGLTTPDAAEAEAKGLMLAAGRRRIVLADRTKLGVARLHRHGRLDDVDLLITDAGADADALDALRRAGVEVETA
ncbi:DeoR/GlpR family DNA-binding transcription regulator [Patulibacter sp. S7RM1-6]